MQPALCKTGNESDGQSHMDVQSLIWTLIAVTGMLDYVLFVAEGMTITVNWGVAILPMIQYGLSRLMRRRYPSAARLFEAFAQILAFCQVGGYLTYGAMAASPFPLADGLLSRADAALGFDWLAWFMWLQFHPALHWMLSMAYASVPLQVAALLAYFACTDPKRIDELVLGTIISVGIITPCMVLLPAVGAWTQHGVGLVEPWRGAILALRSHTLLTVGATQGIVSFPSFHTASAVLLANMARGRKWFLPVLVLNATMIASVMSEGAHYGVDMLSGLAVALIAIAASRSILAWCSLGRRSFPAIEERPATA
jgi:membrane-associated phospholipid phosphatase